MMVMIKQPLLPMFFQYQILPVKRKSFGGRVVMDSVLSVGSVFTTTAFASSSSGWFLNHYSISANTIKYVKGFLDIQLIDVN